MESHCEEILSSIESESIDFFLRDAMGNIWRLIFRVRAKPR